MSLQDQSISFPEDKPVDLITSEHFESLREEIENTKDYKLLFENEGIQMFVKNQGEGSNHPSGISRYKYFGKVDYDIDLSFSVFRDDAMRYTWDNRNLGRKILKVFPPKKEGDPINSVIWTTKRGQFLVSHRDFISLQSAKREVDEHGETLSYEMYTRGLEGYVPPNPPFVRANIIYLGMKLWREEGGTRYVCITQADPGGWISSSIVNWVVKYVPKEYEKGIIKGCEYRVSNNLSSDPWKNLEF